MRRADGELTFLRPGGVPIPAAPALPEWAQGPDDAPLAPTIARLASQGLSIDPRATTLRSDGKRLDLGWTLDVLYVPAETSQTH